MGWVKKTMHWMKRNSAFLTIYKIIESFHFSFPFPSSEEHAYCECDGCLGGGLSWFWYPQYHPCPCTVPSHCSRKACALQGPFPRHKGEDTPAFFLFIVLHLSKTACGYLQLSADDFTTAKEKQLNSSGLG